MEVRDLRNSGKFNPIAADRMPQQPTSATEVTPDVWSSLGVDAIVVGQVTPSGSGYNIAYQLVIPLALQAMPVRY